MKSAKRVFLLNAIAGMLNAGQSFIILFVLSRTSCIEDSGLFAFAYSIACLFLTIAMYGMRTYQVSDTQEQVFFNCYLISRAITCGVMLVGLCFFELYGIMYNHYSVKKIIIIAVVCLWKMVDALSDVFYADWQVGDKLNQASVSIIFRTIFSLFAFVYVILYSHSLVYACFFACLSNYIVFFISLKMQKRKILFYKNIKRNYLIKILKECLPICIMSFLAMYLANISKYAIDKNLTDYYQAIYGYIAMPVFLIELIGNWIIQPNLFNMSMRYNEKSSLFLKYVKKQFLYITAIALFTILLGLIMGIPILSIIYNTNLYQYKFDFAIVLLGGYLLAIAGYMMTILTIMRKQKWGIIAYFICGLLATIFSNSIVTKFQFTGATVLYTLSIGLVVVILFIVVCVYIEKYKKLLNDIH